LTTQRIENLIKIIFFRHHKLKKCSLFKCFRFLENLLKNTLTVLRQKAFGGLMILTIDQEFRATFDPRLLLFFLKASMIF